MSNASVRHGGFQDWLYCYWGQTADGRVPQDPAAVAKAITPDYALGGHTASLGLCWLPAGTLRGFPEGMAIGQHGSWNRSTLSGYKVVFVPFANGRPAGSPRDILTGFLAPDERASYGRPVGVAIGPDDTVLVADDVGDVIWRVTSEQGWARCEGATNTCLSLAKACLMGSGRGYRTAGRIVVPRRRRRLGGQPALLYGPGMSRIAMSPGVSVGTRDSPLIGPVAYDQACAPRRLTVSRVVGLPA